MTKVMKNSLVALVWALIALPAFAQKTLPVSMQNHKSLLNPTQMAAVKHLGFDVDITLAQAHQPVAGSRSNPLRLDSIKAFNGYDFHPAGDSVETGFTTYAYPQSHEKIETVYSTENGERFPLSRSFVYSDDQDRIIEVLGEAWDPEKGDFVPDSRAVSYPHEDDLTLIDSIYVYALDSATQTWVTIFFTINTYDAQDRLLESVSSFDYFGQQVLFKDVHTYDTNGDNILVESFAVFEGLEFPNAKREITYQNHLPVEVISYVTDGVSGFTVDGRITYAYNNFDLIAQVNTYLWSVAINDWLQVMGTTYAYDGAKRETSRLQIVYNQNGTEEHEIFTSDYEQDDQLHSEAHGVGDASAVYLLADRTFYFYSDETLAGREPQKMTMPLQVMPNPTADVIRLGLEEQAMVQVYSLQGNLLMSGSFQPNALISLESLPSGVYVIAAQDAQNLYSCRLVKE